MFKLHIHGSIHGRKDNIDNTYKLKQANKPKQTNKQRQAHTKVWYRMNTNTFYTHSQLLTLLIIIS